MKKIEAIIKPFKLNEVKMALNELGTGLAQHDRSWIHPLIYPPSGTCQRVLGWDRGERKRPGGS